MHSQDQSIRLRLYSSGSFGAASSTSSVFCLTAQLQLDPEFCVHIAAPRAPSRRLQSKAGAVTPARPPPGAAGNCAGLHPRPRSWPGRGRSRDTGRRSCRACVAECVPPAGFCKVQQLPVERGRRPQKVPLVDAGTEAGASWTVCGHLQFEEQQAQIKRGQCNPYSWLPCPYAFTPGHS